MSQEEIEKKIDEKFGNPPKTEYLWWVNPMKFRSVPGLYHVQVMSVDLWNVLLFFVFVFVLSFACKFTTFPTHHPSDPRLLEFTWAFVTDSFPTYVGKRKLQQPFLCATLPLGKKASSRIIVLSDSWPLAQRRAKHRKASIPSFTQRNSTILGRLLSL